MDKLSDSYIYMNQRNCQKYAKSGFMKYLKFDGQLLKVFDHESFIPNLPVSGYIYCKFNFLFHKDSSVDNQLFRIQFGTKFFS